MEASPYSQRPRPALHSGSRSASSSHSAPGAGFQQQAYGSADTGRTQAPAQRGHTQRGSEEIISNLIFSLTPISNQSDQLLDQLLPEQESFTQRPGSKTKRRAQTSYSTTSRSIAPRSAPAGEAPSFFSPVLKETVVVADKYRDRGELPTVVEGSPSSNRTPRAESRGQKRNSLPPPMPVPRRSNSLHATSQPPTVVANQFESQLSIGAAMEEQREMFGSVSVMPGRTNSPSITSTDSVGRRAMTGLMPSRGKSTKSRIKELDAERKKRLSMKNAPRSPGMSKTAKGQHSPSLSKSFAGSVPRVSIDQRAPSPSKPVFLRHKSSQSSRSTSALGHTEAPMPDASEPVPAAPSEAAWGKRVARPAGGAGGSGGDGVGGFVVPPRASSKQTLESVQAARASLAAEEAQRRGEASRAAAERDEAGTTQRIQELRAQKVLRERRESESSRPPLADIALSSINNTNTSTNGNATTNGLHSQGRLADSLPPDEYTLSTVAPARENLSRKPSMAATDHQLVPPQKLVSASLAEPRISSQLKRPFSNVGNYPRPSVDADTYSIADSIDEDVDEYLLDPRLSQKIYHQDTGRCVSYSEVGDPDGFVIMCCVGMGTSRYVTAFYDELAQTLGLRLITPERPGIGDSEPYVPGEVDTPLGWPDDIRLICQHLNISRFALLAHSAGAIYALATALRMPGNIRGRVHILAPWIPPSQLMAIGQNEEPVPVAELPLIQRILKSIPEAWLEAATRVFNMSSITSSLGKSPYAKRRRNTMPNGEKRPNRGETPAPARGADEAVHSAPTSPSPQDDDDAGNDNLKSRRQSRAASTLARSASAAHIRPNDPRPTLELDLDTLTAEERVAEYDRRLTAMIWQLATSNANPAVDLLVCLERKQEIGFRYEDITKPIVLHHGTKDTRVNVDNVVWLGENMRRCEVRILEDEGHGLMANARVMYSVLSEMAQDWRDWNAVVKGRKQ